MFWSERDITVSSFSAKIVSRLYAKTEMVLSSNIIGYAKDISLGVITSPVVISSFSGTAIGA